MSLRLAISNLAWDPADEEAAAALMKQAGVSAVELAPTLVWKDPTAVTPAEAQRYRDVWASRGFPIVAMQSLLFGQPHLQLFDRTTHDELRTRLERLVDLASALGARVLVFGSPKNRRRGSLSDAEATEIAVPFFRRVGDYAAAKNVCLCIEPNPTRYECDFVTTAAAGAELVQAVGSPGFGLHLDAAGMLLSGDDPAAEVRRFLPMIQHLHLSAPDLGPVLEDGPVDYTAILRVLHEGGYRNWVSVEMRTQGAGAAALEKQARTYQQMMGLIRQL